MAQENSVSFKVFLNKVGWTDQTEVRRFGIDRDVVSNFSYLREKLQVVFPSLKSATFFVNWKDAEGDSVLISSDEELMIALTEMQTDVRKLYVTLMESPNRGQQPGGCLALHSGVSCDGCNTDVRGFRYKCLSCPDFDLCTACESAGKHSEHFMVRMPVPINWRPSFGRRLSHHLSKCTRKGGDGCHTWTAENSGECQKKSASHEGGGPHRGRHHHRGPHGGHHGGPQGGHHGGPHGGHHGGPNGGEPHCERAGGFNWLDTLATYLSEWSNLPGEGTPSGQATGTAAPASEQTNEQKKQQQEYAAEQHTKYLRSIGQTVAHLLDPFGIDVDVEIRSNSENGPSKPAENKPANDDQTKTATAQESDTAVKEVSQQMSNVTIDAAANTVTMTATNDVEMTAAAPRESPEAEGWTVLNGTEESVNHSGVVPKPRVSLADSAVQNPATDHETLSQEAHRGALAAQAARHSAMVAAMAAQQQGLGFRPLYPNLPAHAPTMSPSQAPIMSQAPFMSQAQAAMSQAQATMSQAQASMNQAQAPWMGQAAQAFPPGARFMSPLPFQLQTQGLPAPMMHPKPHVNAAVHQMMSMGFSNEGGWLTQLLDAHDGNITKVLDVLQPVKK